MPWSVHHVIHIAQHLMQAWTINLLYYSMSWQQQDIIIDSNDAWFRRVCCYYYQQRSCVSKKTFRLVKHNHYSSEFRSVRQFHAVGSKRSSPPKDFASSRFWSSYLLRQQLMQIADYSSCNTVGILKLYQYANILPIIVVSPQIIVDFFFIFCSTFVWYGGRRCWTGGEGCFCSWICWKQTYCSSKRANKIVK